MRETPMTELGLKPLTPEAERKIQFNGGLVTGTTPIVTSDRAAAIAVNYDMDHLPEPREITPEERVADDSPDPEKIIRDIVTGKAYGRLGWPTHQEDLPKTKDQIDENDGYPGKEQRW